MTGVRRVAKRQYGEGAIYPYDSWGSELYRIQWYEPLNPEFPDGAKRRRSKAGFATRKEAANFLREALSSATRGTPVATADLTLAVFMQEFLDSHRTAASTLAAYRRLNRLHIEPYLGNVVLTQLRPARLSKLYLEHTGRHEHAGATDRVGHRPESGGERFLGPLRAEAVSGGVLAGSFRPHRPMSGARRGTGVAPGAVCSLMPVLCPARAATRHASASCAAADSRESRRCERSSRESSPGQRASGGRACPGGLRGAAGAALAAHTVHGSLARKRHTPSL